MCQQGGRTGRRGGRGQRVVVKGGRCLVMWLWYTVDDTSAKGKGGASREEAPQKNDPPNE